MSERKYANAAATTLAASCTAIATTIQVASVTGLPVTFPYVLIIGRGTASEEAVLVTAAAGTTLTVTRGYDSTTAFAHNNGDSVVHGVTAIEFREANAHVNATSGVHGATGDVVGTSDTQTLTNKNLSSGTNTFPSTLATDAEVAAAQAAAQAAAEATAAAALAAHEADTSTHGVATVAGVTEAQTLTNKTLTDPKISGALKDASGDSVVTLTGDGSATLDVDAAANDVQLTNLAGPLILAATGGVYAGGEDAADEVATVGNVQTIYQKTFSTSQFGSVGTNLEKIRMGVTVINTNGSGVATLAHGLGEVPDVVILTQASHFGSAAHFIWDPGSSDATNISIKVLDHANAAVTSTARTVAWVAVVN
jgi:hypothetical protein